MRWSKIKALFMSGTQVLYIALGVAALVLPENPAHRLPLLIAVISGDVMLSAVLMGVWEAMELEVN